MLSIALQDPAHCHANPDDFAVAAPIQYALYGQSVIGACATFNEQRRTLAYRHLGQEVSTGLSAIARGLLKNGIAVDTITSFSQLDYVERGLCHQATANAIQSAFEAHIKAHAPQITLCEDFTLGLAKGFQETMVQLSADMCFGFGTLKTGLTLHPLSFGIQQLCYLIATELGVTDDIDLVEMIESELQDYVTLQDKQLALDNWESIVSSINDLLAHDDDVDDEEDTSEKIAQFNEQYQGIIELADDYVPHYVCENLYFVLTHKKRPRLTRTELVNWLTERIDTLGFYCDPLALSLLDDATRLLHLPTHRQAMEGAGDDALYQKLIFIPQDLVALPEPLCEQVERMGNDAWNTGADCFFKIDLCHPNWVDELEVFASLWQMAQRYLHIE